MSRFAILDTNTGLVENVIEYPEAPSSPPPGFENHYVAIQSDTAGPGWRFDGVTLFDPNPPVVIEHEPAFVARNFFALLTPQDFAAIRVATAVNDTLGLLWASLQAQGDAPIRTSSPRFVQGWSGVVATLGQTRAAEIAAALGF